MYDFLDCKLSPRVFTPSPCTDGYEVSNLISEDPELKSRGFLGYSAIKPPVQIDFQFICPISLCFINIWPCVGSQKSTGFEIQAKSNGTEYSTLCRTYIKESGLVACSRRIYNDERVKCDYPSEFAVRFFKSSSFRSFTSCEELRLIIFQTNSSVPCINRIQIWGEISSECSQKTRETINHLMNRTRHAEVVESDNKSPENETENTFNFPEEFLDELTYEVMAIPMTLPCGKTVDQSTLEKHHDTEAKWGRQPSDPFTGQTFTPTRKAVLNISLKCRIEDFLLKNCDREDVKKIPRTVGTVKRKSDVGMRSCSSKQPRYAVPSTVGSHSLDDLVQSALADHNIVRYSIIEPAAAEGRTPERCAQCGHSENLYRLGCGHLACRSCLAQSRASGCGECGDEVRSSDVRKHHAR